MTDLEESTGLGPGTAPDAPARLAADVTVHRPTEEGGGWLIQRGQSTYLRAGADLARLALALDGRRDDTALAAHLGAPWTEQHVQGALGLLEDKGLLDDGTGGGSPERHRWITFTPPFTIQVTLLRPGASLDRFRPLLGLLAHRGVAVAAVLVALAGIVALASRPTAVQRALGEPLPVSAYAVVLLAYVASTALHELGHALALTHFGGRPSRMGVMLFYFLPAFFCEVTDGWRLPRNRQRVAVALAGVAVQWVIAGLTALVAIWLLPGWAQPTGVLLAVVAYLAGVINLIPLVKLDGYIALMSGLDLPYLRDRTITDARRAVARVLLGGRHPRALERWWSAPFGLACMLFPTYLVLTAAMIWADMFQGWGTAGAVVLTGLLLYLAVIAVRGAARVLREARAAGAGLGRTVLTVAVVGALVAVLLVRVEVPYSVTGAYRTEGGEVELLLAASADHDAVEAGREVRLEHGGLVTRSSTGTATLADASGERTEAPVTAFAPVVMDAPPVATVVAYPLLTTRPPTQPAGLAELVVGDVPLWKFVYLSFIAPGSL